MRQVLTVLFVLRLICRLLYSQISLEVGGFVGFVGFVGSARRRCVGRRKSSQVEAFQPEQELGEESKNNLGVFAH